MNCNKLLTRQVIHNGILSHTFPKPFHVKPEPNPMLVATTILAVALIVTFYALLAIQYIYS